MVGCFQLTGILQFVVRTSTEVEARFNSVERLLEYTNVRPKYSLYIMTRVQDKKKDHFQEYHYPSMHHHARRMKCLCPQYVAGASFSA